MQWAAQSVARREFPGVDEFAGDVAELGVGVGADAGEHLERQWGVELVALGEDAYRLADHRAGVEGVGELLDLLREFERRSAIATDLVTSGNVERVAPETATALFRITQEALTNIVRHAEASLVKVELACGEREVMLAISDDGRGFDPGHARRSPSLGLLGMRERAAKLGGSVDLQSVPDKGTRLIVRISAAPAPTELSETAA